MLTDTLIVLLRRWRWIALTIVVCGLAGFLLASIVSKTYVSKAVIKLTEDNSTSITSLMENLPIKGMIPMGGQTGGANSKMFLEILGSREVLTALIRKQKLDTVYKKDQINLILKRLERDLSFEYSESGMMSLSYEQSDSVMVCRVLQDLITLGVDRYDSLQKERVHHSVMYLNERESEIRDSFNLFQDSLLEFYRRNKIFDAEGQAKASLDVIAGVEASKMSTEIQSDMAKKSGGENSSVRAQLASLRTGYDKQINDIGNSSIFVDPRKMLKLVLEEKKRLGKFALFSGAYQAIVKERMITEAKLRSRIEPVQVIQNPYVPDWKEKPKRGTWMLVGLLMGGIFSLFFHCLQAIYSREIRLSAGLDAQMALLREGLSRK